MKHFKNIREAYAVCDALGSAVRLEIMEQILAFKAVNLDTLAKNLHLTNGALTKHIKKLEAAGLIYPELVKGKRGLNKRCVACADKILIDVSSGADSLEASDSELPLGLYCDYKVSGLCGLVSKKGYIGRRDDIASFISPLRAEAAAVWLEKGFLTYLLPENKQSGGVSEYIFTFEISPDILGNGAKKESIVSFSLSGTDLGGARIYAPENTRRGFNTPAWHSPALPQYGILKTLRITQKGTFLDGERLNGQLFDFSKKPSRFSISTQEGFIIFGRGFGDYDSGIRYDIAMQE